MADIRFRVPDSFIDELRKTLQANSYTDVVKDALTLLKWASDERKKGRIVVSSDSNGRSVVRLALNSLEGIKPELRAY